MDLDEFTAANAPKDGGDAFQKENSKLLDITVDDSVMVKAGSMVAYTGDLTFTGKSSAEGGITGMVKEAVSSEGTPIMEAEGSGHLYVAEQEKKVQVLSLDADEGISVNGNDILAFESRVDYEIKTIGGLSEAAAGGLTNVHLSGPGTVALTTHGDPLVATPPITTDPDATVAWSTNLSPSVGTNKMIEIGQSSNESIQMNFTGSEGFVVVQPFEEGGQRQQ
jgi:uncharacterized protein (AIM24 family)